MKYITYDQLPLMRVTKDDVCERPKVVTLAIPE